MNNDKNEIVTAAKAKGLSNAAYAAQLRTACQSLLTDEGKAEGIPKAPLAGLNKDWDGLLAATRAYARSCLVLVAHPSTANYNAFKSKLDSMDLASQGLNEAIQSAASTGH